MKTRYIAIPIVMLAVLALAAFSTPAMAGDCPCDVETTTNACNHGTNGTVNGTIYVDGAGRSELGTTTVEVDFEDIPAGMTVKWARVYWHIWMPGSWTNATFCNESGCTYNNQTDLCDPSESCTCEQDETDGFYGGGCGTTWVYWNVTNLVASGSNNITVVNDASSDGRTMWVYLVAVLENTTKYSPMNYTINQGYEDIESGEKSPTWFYGPANNSRDGTLWHLALCSDVTSGGIWFNTYHVRNDIPGDMTEEEITHENENIKNNDNNMTWDDGDDDWFHPVMAIFMDNVSLRPGKDLKVAGIELPDVMRPATGCTIKATIKNQGEENAEGFNVSLYINGSYNAKNESITGLNSGSSTTVSFSSVTLPKGCHDFKVFADSDGEVTESMETNNNRTKKYQVGYVIVVESYNDFDDLVTESNNNLLGAGNVSHSGDTYYIKNFTGSSAIENCAGDGITIKNLNATTKFEINNCTIKNCTRGSGVFLHNLTNGTINGSVMQNNSYYGIEVGLVPLSDEDPQFVNITNSTVKENKLVGIELIGCNFTVRNNTVQNNTQQGIYLFGNDTNITYNNVTDNTGYGVKLYNSTGNYVYGNNFTGNRISNKGHQANDTWKHHPEYAFNHWNTSVKGNWWSDRALNPGCPNNYSIDGGNNKDYHPEGPTSTEPHTYDFSTGAGTNKWAYKPQLASNPPGTNNVPSTEFSSSGPDEYDRIASDNDQRQVNVADDEYYAAHRFKFTISEDSGVIDKINVTWNGIGYGDGEEGTPGATLRIWNYTSSAYEELADSGGTNAEVNLTGEKTSSISSYISSSNLIVLVEQKGITLSEGGYPGTSEIKTDYVKVVITASCG